MTMIEMMNKAKEMNARRWSKNKPAIAEQQALTGFVCEECGSECSFFDLECWCCNFEVEEPYIICSLCYEEAMGDDL